METIMYVLLVIAALIVVFAILTYNGLVRRRNSVESAWHQIDTLLQKRYDLVPNLIETVKGYMEHEKDVLESVTQARTQWMNAESVKDVEEAENQVAGALKTVFATSESYPELKSNENFLKMQEDLSAIENKLAYARQRYNRVVQSYNTAIEKFPAVIFASIMGFDKSDYFEVDNEEARENVKVEF